MNVSTLSAAQLRRAAEIAERIESLNAELSGILSDGNSSSSSDMTPTRGKRGMSAAGRARIAAAARARWAKVRAEKGASVSGPGKKKRTMSAAAKAKISAAAKARWAKIKSKS